MVWLVPQKKTYPATCWFSSPHDHVIRRWPEAAISNPCQEQDYSSTVGKVSKPVSPWMSRQTQDCCEQSRKTTKSPSNSAFQQSCKGDKLKANTMRVQVKLAAWPLFSSAIHCRLDLSARVTFLFLLVAILWTLWLPSVERWPRLQLPFYVSGDFLFVGTFYDLTSRMDFSKLGADLEEAWSFDTMVSGSRA